MDAVATVQAALRGLIIRVFVGEKRASMKPSAATHDREPIPPWFWGSGG